MYRAVGPGFHFGNFTSDAGTPITCLCPPMLRAHTRLTSLYYDSGGYGHTLTILKALGKTTLSVTASLAATSITLASDPGTGTSAGNIAIGDWVCIQLDDGSFFLSKVYALSTLTLTIAALPYSAALGNTVWFFGTPSDHAPTAASQTRSASPPTLGIQVKVFGVLDPARLGDPASGICASNNPYEPLMIHSDNLSVAGTLRLAAGCHTLN